MTETSTMALSSPDINGNGTYVSDLDCVWTVIAGDNNIINLQFNSFVLDDQSQNCTDYVEVSGRTSAVKLKFHWDQFSRNFPVANVTGKSPTSYEEVGDVANRSARKLRGNWSQWNLSLKEPGHFEVRKSSSQVTRSQGSSQNFLWCALF